MPRCRGAEAGFEPATNRSAVVQSTGRLRGRVERAARAEQVHIGDAAAAQQQLMLQQVQEKAQRRAALELQAELARALAQACWQEDWQEFCWQRQQQEEANTAATETAAQQQQLLLRQQQMHCEAEAGQHDGQMAERQAQQQAVQRAVQQAAAAEAGMEVGCAVVGAAGGRAAVSVPGKRQRVGAKVIDLEMMVQSAPALVPAAAAAEGRASGARSTRGRAPPAKPRAPAKPSAAKPPPRVGVVKPAAAQRPRGRQARPSRAERAAWPAMRDAAMRAGCEFVACWSCGEPAYEGTLCGRGGEYCEHNDDMESGGEGAPHAGIEMWDDAI